MINRKTDRKEEKQINIFKGIDLKETETQKKEKKPDKEID
jgi:hypothetical protein